MLTHGDILIRNSLAVWYLTAVCAEEKHASFNKKLWDRCPTLHMAPALFNVS